VDEMPRAVRRLVYFRQEGAPLHFAGDVRNWLGEVIHGRWIGRRGKIEWSPRSPNLSSLDLSIWGNLKSLVYHVRPRAINDLTVNTGVCAAYRGSTPHTHFRTCAMKCATSYKRVQATGRT
jgi:hypothetical protein